MAVLGQAPKDLYNERVRHNVYNRNRVLYNSNETMKHLQVMMSQKSTVFITKARYVTNLLLLLVPEYYFELEMYL